MAVYSYALAKGRTRWMYVIDLPAGTDGRRRQMKRKGFPSQTAAWPRRRTPAPPTGVPI